MDLTPIASLENLRAKGWLRCETPILRKTATHSYFGTCGKCIICDKRRRAQWVGKLLLEHAFNTLQYGNGSSIFLTLTYNDENLGPTKLVKSDIQKFFKRFRTNSQKSVRYFAAGEYGSQKGRKHWHCLLWGPELHKQIAKLGRSSSETGPTQRLRHLTLEEQLSECWGKGFVHVRDIIPQRVAYVAKYATKAATEHDPMILFSNKPGLGYPMMRHMMHTLAKSKPELQRVPSTFTIGNRRYSMGSSLHRAARKFYTLAGGQITLQSNTKQSSIMADFQIGWRGEVKRRIGV